MSLERGNKSNDEIEKLLKINDLMYSPASDLSVVSSRNWRKYYPDNGSSFVGGNSIQFTLSASNYIMGPECWLEFDLQATSTATTVNFSKNHDGSAMNIINSAILTNGDEIDRSELCNLRYYHLNAFLSSNGEQVHGERTVMGHRLTTNLVNVKNSSRYAIPLKYILPCFSNRSQLMPLGMIAGSKLKITLENAKTALIPDSADPAIAYSVTDPVIYLAEYKLQESAEMRLNLHGSQKPGLVFQYESYNHQSVDKTSTAISRNVAPAVSHLVSIFATNRDTNSINNEVVDSLICRQFPDDSTFSFSYRLGSVRYPEEQVDKQVSAYLLAQQSLAPEMRGDNTVSIHAFRGDPLTDVEGHGVLGMTFNRSVAGGLSGVSLNSNSVQAWLDYNDSLSIAGGQTIDVFSKHVRACSTFSDGKISVNF